MGSDRPEIPWVTANTDSLENRLSCDIRAASDDDDITSWHSANYNFLEDQTQQITIGDTSTGDEMSYNDGIVGLSVRPDGIFTIQNGVVTKVSEIIKPIKAGDSVHLKIVANEPVVTVMHNGIRVPQHWTEYPRWWWERTRMWWLERTNELLGRPR